jgi:hypothetical protein
MLLELEIPILSIVHASGSRYVVALAPRRKDSGNGRGLVLFKAVVL